jgi:cobalt-zinc-cadmium efflux system membrane fusion protein
MNYAADSGTILVVEGDATLAQVLSRVLARDGLKIAHAVNTAQALQLADVLAPQIVLMDAALRDGDNRDLAKELHARDAELPLIVVTSNPEASQAAAGNGRVTRYLTKPLDLQALRQTVEAALADAANHRPSGPDTPGLPVHAVMTPSAAKESVMRVYVVPFLKVAGFVALLVAVLAGFAVAMGAVRPPWQRAPVEDEQPPPKPAALGVVLVKQPPHTLAVPEEVRMALGIRKGTKDLIAEAKLPTKGQILVMTGSTALDPTRLYRIRARFAPSPSSALVTEIAQVPEIPAEPGKSATTFREIRSDDRVKKGDLLAVFHSVDVGNKKNDLIDAIYQLDLDDRIVKKMEEHLAAISEVQYLTSVRQRNGDVNAINRAVNTLKEWGISDQDIQAVRDEAERVKQRGGKRDPSKDAEWARVELRAPDDGVIIERNVALHENVVDNTTNLFQIAKLDRLAVYANVPEDDVPILEGLPTSQRRWTIQTVGSPPIEGYIDDISHLIDPNQHTAPVKGHIDNPRELLRGGQFVTATVQLPPPADVVEVPVDAVVEDGQQAIVFVQTDPEKHPDQFTLRRVQVTHRFDKTLFVRSKEFTKAEQPSAEERALGLLSKEPLRPGDRVLQTAVGELKAALLDKEETLPQNDEN